MNGDNVMPAGQETPFWFGKVVNGCDPSALDPDYVRLNLDSGIRAFATTVCIKEGFVDTCTAILHATHAAENAGVGVLSTRDDIANEGPKGLILGLQNTSAFEGSLLLLEALTALGVGIVQLTYNEQNFVGSGCMEPDDGGLSKFGGRVVARLQELGVAVDLSHCGRRTAREAIALASGPVLFTHANCDALCPNPRNRTDEEIRAVADTGGVIGLNAFPYFVDPQEPDVDRLARHAAHISEIASSSNVTLGLDFIRGRDLDWVASLGYDDSAYPTLEDWPESYAKGIEDVTCIGKLAAALARVGFSQVEISGIFWSNLCRVLVDVWPSSRANLMGATDVVTVEGAPK